MLVPNHINIQNSLFTHVLVLIFLTSVPCVLELLNQAPRHEGVLGSGGMAPRIIHLGARWR